jgi:hypothetical protein
MPPNYWPVALDSPRDPPMVELDRVRMGFRRGDNSTSRI